MQKSQTCLAKFKKTKDKRQHGLAKWEKKEAKKTNRDIENAQTPNLFGEIQKDKRQKTTRFGEMRKKRGQKDKPWHWKCTNAKPVWRNSKRQKTKDNTVWRNEKKKRPKRQTVTLKMHKRQTCMAKLLGKCNKRQHGLAKFPREQSINSPLLAYKTLKICKKYR